MVSQIYPSELQTNKINTSDTKTAFLDLHLSISNDIVSTNFFITTLILKLSHFPFLNVDVPHSLSYGVYIFQLIRFPIASSHVADFNIHSKLLSQKLLKQGYRYLKL